MQTLAQITVTPAVSDATNFSLAMQPALGRSNQIFVATALEPQIPPEARAIEPDE